MLPGLHGTTRLFDAFVAMAPPWARCRPLSLPREGPQDFDSLARAFEPQVRPLEGFVLIAESYSGPVAARISALLGSKLALLVLCNPLTASAFLFPPRLAASLASATWVPAWTAALLMTGGDRALARAMLRQVRALPRQTLIDRISIAQRTSPADIVTHVSSPLLSILGTRDLLVRASSSRDSIGRIPYSTVVELDAPHLVIQSHPADVWAAITGEFSSAA